MIQLSLGLTQEDKHPLLIAIFFKKFAFVKPFTCAKCDKKFKGQSFMQHHNGVGQGPFKLILCCKRVSSQGD